MDASALVAVVFNEGDGERLTERLTGVAVSAPTLLKFELANVALKARRDPSHTPQIFRALAVAVTGRFNIHWHDVDATDVAILARATGLSAYDASYLWLAGTLGADLITPR